MSEYNGYIPAGFDSYVTIIKNRVDEKYWPFINNHFQHKSKGVMSCFGEKVVASKKRDENIERYIKILESLNESKISTGLNNYIDSGGYQVMSGKLDLEGIEYLSDNYYKFLENNTHLYSKAFILDLPVNDKCFNSYDDVYYHNHKSYKRASELPYDVRSKVLYVSHFGNTDISNISNKIFNELDAINTFSQFSIGGIAGRTNKTKHFIYYFTIPIVYYLNHAIKNGINKLHIHFLGADSPASILFYKLAEIIALERHGITLEITYDSAVFHRLILGKGFRCIDNGVINEICYRSKNVDKNFGYNKSSMERIKNILNDFARNNNLAEYTDNDHIYNGDDLNGEMEVRMLIYHTEYMYDMARILYNGVYEAYKHYDTNIHLFNEYMFNTIKNGSKGRFGRNQKKLHSDLPDVVKILHDLDGNKTMRTLKNQGDNTNIFNNNILTV